MRKPFHTVKGLSSVARTGISCADSSGEGFTTQKPWLASLANCFFYFHPSHQTSLWIGWK